MKALFGKDNTWHTHSRPWVDQPLVISNFFGAEGLNDTGISFSRIFPNSHDLFVEATGEVFRGDVENVFQARNQNDLFYNGHLKLFKDITENSNIEVGASLARGNLVDANGSSVFGGLDVTYRWKPLSQATRRSFISRTEVIGNDRDDQSRKNWGFYTAAEYQLAQRWFTGVRLDRADRPNQPGLTDEGASWTLTFWPSEFSQIRGQLRHMRYEDAKDTNELLLQLQFAIGAHGAHAF